MSALCKAACLAMVLPLAPPAFAGSAEAKVTIGGVEVPATCALVRKEHPRLLFTQADLPRLRERLKNPHIAAELEHAKQLAAQKKAGAILLGVLYYLTGQQEYIEQAKAMLQPSWEPTYPLAADLVMGAMTPAEQQAEADRNRGNCQQGAVASAPGAGPGRLGPRPRRVPPQRFTDPVPGRHGRGIAYNNLWSQGRGGSSMSHGYYGEHFYSEWFTMAVAWSNATGQDWVGKCDFAAHTPEYYLFHYRPWAWPPQVVHIGVNAMCGHWEAITPAKFEGDNLAVLAAARFHDGVGQWWINEVISKISMGWGTSALGQGGVWGKLLWYDPELPPVDPKMLPPARLLPRERPRRHAFRLDAGSNLRLVPLRALRRNRRRLGPQQCRQSALHHQQAGHPGGRHRGRPFAQQCRPTLRRLSGPQRRPAAHSRVRPPDDRAQLDHRGQRPAGTPRWTNAGNARNGTQRRPIADPGSDRGGRPGDWRSRSPATDRSRRARSSPTRLRLGSTTRPAMPPTPTRPLGSSRSRGSSSTFDQSTFVVFDRVVNAAAGLETKWLLHALYEPAFDGQTAPRSVPAVREDNGWSRAGGTSTRRIPIRAVVSCTGGGSVFTIDDRWPGMTGRLFVKILLPGDDQRVLRTVGGPWHEFEVEGINYGPTEDTYKKSRKRRRMTARTASDLADGGSSFRPRTSPLR